MEVKVLGTVSPYCKDDKNGPGFLVYSNDNKILLDCGSGVTRLMKMPGDLENLNIILSHYHRDHYADIFSLAYASYVYHNLGLLNKRIKVYIPSFNYSDDECFVDYKLLTKMGKEHYFEVILYDNIDKIEIDGVNISFTENPHSIKSNGIKVQDEETTLVYSGDTGFKNNSLETFAKNSSLLICESTFLRGQKGSKDFHLCAFEAGIIANKAQVKQLMLTHFWPEIKGEEYVLEAKQEFNNVLAAQEGKILKLHK